jgi:hypothetical protein
MKTIKFLKNKSIRLNNITYKPYLVGKLPQKFAYIYDEDEEKEGITEWFNYKGLTYIEAKDSIWNEISKDNERMNVEMLFNSMK